MGSQTHGIDPVKIDSYAKEIKKVFERDIMLAYPDYSKPFEVYTDASALQLGAVIVQDGRPIAFF